MHFATGVPASLQSAVSSEGKDGDADVDVTDGVGEVAVLSEGKAEATPRVLSGMRNSSSILIFIDLKAALTDGLGFWMSENGVVLSGGDASGIVGLKYFQKVVERGGREGTGGGKVLVENGTVIADAEERASGHGHGRGRGGGGDRGRGGRGGSGGRGMGGSGEGGTHDT